MKWIGWSVFSLVVLAGALSALAAEPMSSRRGFLRPTVVSVEETSAVQDRSAPPPPVHYRLVAGSIWAGSYGGYVYEPGACDYKPPCVDHLWDGYCQHPHRCFGTGLFGWHHGGCGWFGHRCGHCGLFGHHGGCGCDDTVGCDVKAPDCGAKPSCGYEDSCGCGGHFGHHFKHKCHHFFHRCKAHWTCGCGTDVDCGCGGDVKGGMPVPVAPEGVPPAPIPDMGEKAASAEIEDAPPKTRPVRVPAFGSAFKSYFQR